jgi:hypothetical protein
MMFRYFNSEQLNKKIFLWKYFKFIRLLIKIGSQWSIVNQFFVIDNQLKKLNIVTLTSNLKRNFKIYS